jgi:hypothetical protein
MDTNYKKTATQEDILQPCGLQALQQIGKFIDN